VKLPDTKVNGSANAAEVKLPDTKVNGSANAAEVKLPDTKVNGSANAAEVKLPDTKVDADVCLSVTSGQANSRACQHTTKPTEAKSVPEPSTTVGAILVSGLGFLWQKRRGAKSKIS
jgi:hypothetical protein